MYIFMKYTKWAVPGTTPLATRFQMKMKIVINAIIIMNSKKNYNNNRRNGIWKKKKNIVVRKWKLKLTLRLDPLTPPPIAHPSVKRIINTYIGAAAAPPSLPTFLACSFHRNTWLCHICALFFNRGNSPIFQFYKLFLSLSSTLNLSLSLSLYSS